MNPPPLSFGPVWAGLHRSYGAPLNFVPLRCYARRYVVEPTKDLREA